jgi:hypothetical protein
MELPEDVVKWVDTHFSDADKSSALAVLQAASIHTGEAAGPRLLRCAAISSHGSLRRLEALVQHLRVDWRDVIMAAEYKPSGGTLHGSSNPKRIFDFNRPIEEATVTDDRS